MSASGGRALIDPEALVLVSTIFARHDARLFDEMLDWLRANGTWINVLRLTHLQREFELGDRTVLGAMAEYLIQDSAHLKWKVLAKTEEPAIEPRPLFPHLAVFDNTDETFRHWGWLRAPIERRRLAARPDQTNRPPSSSSCAPSSDGNPAPKSWRGCSRTIPAILRRLRAKPDISEDRYKTSSTSWNYPGTSLRPDRDVKNFSRPGMTSGGFS